MKVSRRAFLTAIASALGVRRASVPAVRVDGISSFAQAHQIAMARLAEAFSDATASTRKLADSLNNPVWVIYDACLRSGWRPEELDLASFHKAALECSRII